MRLGRAMAITAALAAPARAATHCGPGEDVVFSCSTGAKTASVCAAKDLIQYRFGRDGRPELVWPPASDGRDKVRAGTWTFAGGGGAWLAFHKPPFRYVVYTAIGRGWGEKAGVAVEQNGLIAANLPCENKPVSAIGPDFFARAGIGNDDVPFDLP